MISTPPCPVFVLERGQNVYMVLDLSQGSLMQTVTMAVMSRGYICIRVIMGQVRTKHRA